MRSILKLFLPSLAMVILFSCELIDDNPGTDDVRDKIEGQWKCEDGSDEVDNATAKYTRD